MVFLKEKIIRVLILPLNKLYVAIIIAVIVVGIVAYIVVFQPMQGGGGGETTSSTPPQTSTITQTPSGVTKTTYGVLSYVPYTLLDSLSSKGYNYWFTIMNTTTSGLAQIGSMPLTTTLASSIRLKLLANISAIAKHSKAIGSLLLSKGTGETISLFVAVGDNKLVDTIKDNLWNISIHMNTTPREEGEYRIWSVTLNATINEEEYIIASKTGEVFGVVVMEKTSGFNYVNVLDKIAKSLKGAPVTPSFNDEIKSLIRKIPDLDKRYIGFIINYKVAVTTTTIAGFPPGYYDLGYSTFSFDPSSGKITLRTYHIIPRNISKTFDNLVLSYGKSYSDYLRIITNYIIGSTTNYVLKGVNLEISLYNILKEYGYVETITTKPPCLAVQNAAFFKATSPEGEVMNITLVITIRNIGEKAVSVLEISVPDANWSTHVGQLLNPGEAWTGSFTVLENAPSTGEWASGSVHTVVITYIVSGANKPETMSVEVTVM